MHKGFCCWEWFLRPVHGLGLTVAYPKAFQGPLTVRTEPPTGDPGSTPATQCRPPFVAAPLALLTHFGSQISNSYARHVYFLPFRKDLVRSTCNIHLAPGRLLLLC